MATPIPFERFKGAFRDAHTEARSNETDGTNQLKRLIDDLRRWFRGDLDFDSIGTNTDDAHTVEGNFVCHRDGSVECSIYATIDQTSVVPRARIQALRIAVTMRAVRNTAGEWRIVCEGGEARSLSDQLSEIRGEFLHALLEKARHAAWRPIPTK